MNTTEHWDSDRFNVYIDTQFGPDLRGMFPTEDSAQRYVAILKKRGHLNAYVVDLRPTPGGVR